MPDNRPPSDEQWETFVRDTARDLPYPPTPNISQAVTPAKSETGRAVARWRLAAAALVIALLAVPEVRAAVLSVLRIGGMQIIFVEPTVTPTLQASRTPRPTPTPEWLASALDLPGETTLEQVQKQVNFPILLPSELGMPDKLYLQQFGGPVITLVWLAPNQPDTLAYVLQIFDPRAAASKLVPFNAGERPVTVNGKRGYWIPNAHEVVFFGPQGDFRRLVRANVLVWEMGRITYRLETQQPQKDAVRIAESLQP